MEYLVEERSLAADDEGYLLEPDYSDLVCEAIAAAERVSLDEDHGTLLNYLRDQYCEQDHTPNFPTELKDVSEQSSNCDSKRLYDLFALGPAKQGARIAGLPKPYGKGGY